MNSFCISPSLPRKSAFSNDFKQKMEDSDPGIMTVAEEHIVTTERQGDVNYPLV